jgi:hypothetical protein
MTGQQQQLLQEEEEEEGSAPGDTPLHGHTSLLIDPTLKSSARQANAAGSQLLVTHQTSADGDSQVLVRHQSSRDQVLDHDHALDSTLTLRLPTEMAEVLTTQGALTALVAATRRVTELAQVSSVRACVLG